MVNTTRKRPRATIVNQDLVGQASAFLQELPEKQKESMSLREAVEQMQEPLKAALAKGYSYEDLAKMLLGKGIKISALTLKNYVPSGKRQAAKTKAKRSKKVLREESTPVEEASAKEILPEVPVEVSPSDIAPEPAPAPAKAGRGRAKPSETKKTAAAKTKASGETSVQPSRSRKTSTTKTTTQSPPSRRRRKSSPA
jgi:hypothetical protein